MQKMRPKRGCLFYGTIFFVCTPIILIMILIGGLFARDRAAQRRLAARLQEIRARNLPVDDRSMQTYHDSLTSPKNVTAWLDIIEKLSGSQFSTRASTLIQGVPLFDGSEESEVPGSKQEWPNEKPVRTFIAATEELYSQALALSIEQLDSSQKPVRFPISFASFNTSLEHATQLRQVARLLQLHSQVAQFDGNSQKVGEGITGLFGCSQVLAGEPLLISQLVVNAIEGMALVQLNSALRNDALDKAEIEKILPILLSRTDIPKRWKTGLIGERALVMPIYGGGAAAKAAVGRSLPFRNNDALYYLDYSEGLLAVDESQLDTFVDELTKVEQQRAGLSTNPFLMFDAVLTSMVSPSASAMGQSFVRNAVAYRQAALACSVRLVEIEKQEFPESLNDIQIQGIDVAALAPPGKKPFGYEVDEKTGNAFIWGYDTRFSDEVPDERPSADSASPNFDNTVWELTPHLGKSP